MTAPPTVAPVPGDLRMARALGPVLLASAVGLLPFTVFSTFLVPIAEEAGGGVAAMGSLRGLGGLAALAVGAAVAPVLDRLPKQHVAAVALALLGLSSALGATGHFAAMVVFAVLIGAGTSVLFPAMAAMAADRFGDGPAAGRAATLVTATQSLTAMLAAPLVAAPALLWGWRGNLVAVAVIAFALAAVFLTRRGPVLAPRPRIGYLEALRALGSVPGAGPLLAVALLRTAAFMGYLSYLAAYYDERFSLSPGVFALVWTLSGGSYFLGNLLAGRFANAGSERWRPERVMVVGLVIALGAVVGFYAAPTLPVALGLTVLLGASHATVAACVTTLLVRRCGPRRGSALGVNAAGMSLGVFVGSALGGIGLGVAGHPGTAVVLAGLTLAAVGFAVRVRSVTSV
ncbi:MFS transporter [Umezawaea endophytica]|uniref:MFS transporter n=1 Tax=Umezawaea endophytica TaxID=1654476 RepID=UPI0035F0BFF9